MKRLESDLSSLKKRQLSELESTLKLTDIGLPEHLLSEPRCMLRFYRIVPRDISQKGNGWRNPSGALFPPF